MAGIPTRRAHALILCLLLSVASTTFGNEGRSEAYIERLTADIESLMANPALQATFALCDRLAAAHGNVEAMSELGDSIRVCSARYELAVCWNRYCSNLRDAVESDINGLPGLLGPNPGYAIVRIGQSAPHRGFIPLLQAVAAEQSEDPYVRTTAIWAISWTPHDEVVDNLLPYLYDSALSLPTWEQLRKLTRKPVDFHPERPRLMVDDFQAWQRGPGRSFRYDYLVRMEALESD